MFDILPSWLLIIPMLAFLVFVHELGHFWTAKRFGIHVLEFGFGFPPRLFGIRYGETLYSINAIPLGGFVRMLGEEDPTHPRSFASQHPWKRTVVLCAGSLVNLVLPVVIFTVALMVPHEVPVGNLSVERVVPGSPAENAGILPGDRILAVNDEETRHINDLAREIALSGSSVVELSLERESGLLSDIYVTPRLNPSQLLVVETVTDSETEISLYDARRYDATLDIGDVIRQGGIGILVETSDVQMVSESQNILQAVPNAFGQIFDTLTLSKNALQQWTFGSSGPALSGPIGIAQITGEIAEYGIRPFFMLVGLISLSLGIFNILPIPALDGGRLLFVVIEWVRGGKRISPKKEGVIHAVGFGLLLTFIVCVSYFDISRIIAGESIIP